MSKGYFGGGGGCLGSGSGGWVQLKKEEEAGWALFGHSKYHSNHMQETRYLLVMHGQFTRIYGSCNDPPLPELKL